jgi:hypothetical protein
MRVVLLLAIAACDKGPQLDMPPVPAPTPPDARVVIDLPVDAGLDAATPSITNLTAIAMLGPFPTRAKLCEAQACPAQETEGGWTYNVTRDCPSAPEGWQEDRGLHMKSPAAPFTEVFLQSINCRRESIRDDSRTYRIAVRRADGYWVSSEPLFTISGSDKVCGGALDATWQARGPLQVASIKAHTDCLVCNKERTETSGLDLLIAVADAKQPVWFRPLPFGQHHHQDGDVVVDPDNPCPKAHRDAVLSVDWFADHVSLTGTPKWRQPRPADPQRGLEMRVDETVPDSISGNYRFVIP